jgi:hypothetical protein
MQDEKCFNNCFNFNFTQINEYTDKTPIEIYKVGTPIEMNCKEAS